jgi:hypothetical protein
VRENRTGRAGGDGESVILPPTIENWPKAWSELLKERAAIMEFEGNMSRERAEKLAELDIRKLCERQL